MPQALLIKKKQREGNLHTLQRLSSEYEADKKMLQNNDNLTLDTIEDQVRVTYRELTEKNGKMVDDSEHVLVAASRGVSGGSRAFPTPGHYAGPIKGGSTAKGGEGQWGTG